MNHAQRAAARDRLGWLNLRLHALMKKKWREQLAGVDRERLLDIAASKTHECRLLNEKLYELTGWKERYGGNFNTAAAEADAIRTSALVDGEIRALGAEAEIRSKKAAIGAKVKAAQQEEVVKAALLEYVQSPTLKNQSAQRAAELLVSKVDDRGKPKYPMSVDKLKRRISALKRKK